MLVTNETLMNIFLIAGSLGYEISRDQSPTTPPLSDNSMIVYDFNETFDESLDASSSFPLHLSKSTETVCLLEDESEIMTSGFSPVLLDQTSCIFTQNEMVNYHSYTCFPCYSPDLNPNFFRSCLNPNFKYKFSFLTTISDRQIRNILPGEDDHTHYVRGEFDSNETVVTEWDGQSCRLSDYVYSLRWGLSVYPSYLSDSDVIVKESSLVIVNMLEEPSPTTFDYIREIVFCPGSLLHTRKLELSSFQRVQSIVFLPFCDCTAEEFGSTLMGSGDPLEIHITNCPNLSQINFKHHSCIRGSSLILWDLPALSSLKIGFASSDGSWEKGSCCFNRCTCLNLSCKNWVRIRIVALSSLHELVIGNWSLIQCKELVIPSNIPLVSFESGCFSLLSCSNDLSKCVDCSSFLTCSFASN